MDTLAGSLKPPKKPPKHLLTLQEAQKLFEPYKALLAECIQYGWDQWASFYKPKHPVLGARARASIVYDEIVSRVAERFSTFPDVVFKKFRTSFLLYIGDKISVRFKKFGKNGRCSNIKTHQQYLFNLQMEIPGMEKGTMFAAGYALDEIQQNVVRKAVICEFANSVLYQIDLLTEIDAPLELGLAPTPLTPKTNRFEINPEALPESEQVKNCKRKGE